MRIFRSVLSLLVILSAHISWAQTSTLRVDPSCPVVGIGEDATKELRITYSPGTTAHLGNPSKLTLQVGVNGPYWENNTRSVPLERRDDGFWQATLKPQDRDFWLYLMFQVKDEGSGQVDNNGGRYWDVVFCNLDGTRHSQGIEEQARSYTGAKFDNGIARAENYEKAVSALEDYLQSGDPDRCSVLLDYWDYKVRRDGAAWTKTAAEVSRFIEDHRADQLALIGAFNFVNLRSDHLPPDLYPRLMHYIEVVDAAQAARLDRMARYGRIHRERDTRKRADALASFIRKYPQDRQVPQALAQLFQDLRTLQDVGGAEAVFQQRVQSDPNWADTYAAMAAVYIENKQKPEEALQLLNKAEQLGEAQMDPMVSWVQSFAVLTPDPALNATRMASLRARAYLLAGKGERALPLAQKALEAGKTPDNYFVLAQAYEATGAKQQALEAYLEAITRSSNNQMEVRERLARLWTAGGFGTNQQLEEKIRGLEEAAFRKANYKPRLVDRPAPEYEFTTLKGEKFRSADLLDKTVILNFWATWCAPCIPELPGFVELQRKHPDWVVAGLAVSSETETIQKVIRQQKLDALRIAPGDALSEDFGRLGVPVTYVIDRGRIRVVHNQALSNVVAYIEADLAEVKKGDAASSTAR